MAIDAKRYFIPCAIGFAPALYVLATWAPSGDATASQALIREFSLPLIVVELFTIIVAAREGMLAAIRQWKWPRAVLVALAILAGIAIVTAATAQARSPAVAMTIYWFIHGWFAVSVAFLVGRDFEAIDLVRAYLWGFAAFSLLMLFYIANIPDWERFDWKSGFLFFGHIRHAGYYCAAMAGLAIGMMAIASRRGEWWLYFVLASVAAGIAFWTGSRGAALAIGAAVVAGVVLVPAMRSWRGAGGGIASLALAAALASQVAVPPHPLMGTTRMVEQTTGGEVTTGRTVMWRTTIDAIAESPLVGYGEGQMRTVAPFSDMIQPHAILLQVGLAWGLIGLACVFVLASCFALRTIPALQQDRGAAVPAFMAMVAVGILSLYDGALFYILPISIFLACGALVVTPRSTDKA
jgi:O-antigen ligase